ETAPEVPFILFTGKGTEEIASEAISTGVSDFLQKGTGLDDYRLLANRIEKLTERARALSELEATRDWYERLLAEIPGYVIVVDASAEISYCSPSVEHVLGYAPTELVGGNALEYAHPDDVERALAEFGSLLETPARPIEVTFRARHTDGSYRDVAVQGRNLLGEHPIDGVIVSVRPVADGVEG
ncbi:MAG: PAS domain-containing protein, partial [Halobacteriales archaeon]|nr:PAS domain-containing protein [Halobacteriales archaeon]